VTLQSSFTITHHCQGKVLMWLRTNMSIGILIYYLVLFENIMLSVLKVKLHNLLLTLNNSFILSTLCVSSTTVYILLLYMSFKSYYYGLV